MKKWIFYLSLFCLVYSCNSGPKGLSTGTYHWDSISEANKAQTKVLFLRSDSTFSFLGVSLNNPEEKDLPLWVPYHYWITKGLWRTRDTKLILYHNDKINPDSIGFTKEEKDYLNQLKPYKEEEMIFTMMDTIVIFQIESDGIREIGTNYRYKFTQ